MDGSAIQGVDELVARLTEAVRLGEPGRITARVKTELEALVRRSAIRIPDSFRCCDGRCYARRLVHRDPADGFTVVAMTWGPGQRTQIHDHAGIWCVECVVEGRLSVTQFDLTGSQDERFSFTEKSRILAGVGDAGCLIPPFEYHVMHNPCDKTTAVTLHVYGGEMERCNLYLPRDGGWWERQSKQLAYDN